MSVRDKQPSSELRHTIRGRTGIVALFRVELLLVFVLLFLVFGLHYHGFSITSWQIHLRLPSSDVVAGQPQPLRSDDWLVSLPVAISQTQRPQHRFGATSDLLGPEPGVPVYILPTHAPALHFATFFRPYVWGYFFDPEIGLSWTWCFYLSAGILSVAVLCYQLGVHDRYLCTFVGSFVYTSAFFLGWSLNCSPVTIAFGFLVAELLRVLPEGKVSWQSWVWIAYWSGAFLFALYPPYQLAAVWVGIVLVSGAVASGKLGRDALVAKSKVSAVVLLALIVGAICFALALYEARDAVERTIHTDYPGQRRETQGPGWLSVFSGTVFPQAIPSLRNRFDANLCEETSFSLIGLCLMPAVLYLRFRDRFTSQINSPSGWYADLALAALTALFMARVLAVLPEQLVDALRLGAIPPKRMKYGIGLLNIVWLIRFLQLRQERSREAGRMWPLAAICMIVAAAAPVCGLYRYCNTAAFAALLALAVLGCIAGSLIVRWPRVSVSCLVVLQLYAMGWWNPVVLGGVKPLLRCHSSEVIRSIDSAATQASGKRPLWVTFGNIYDGDFLRMLGLRAANGVQFYPQFSFWKLVDPTGSKNFCYNRYSHVIFEFTKEAERIDVRLVPPDQTIVKVHPDNPALARAGISHLATRQPLELDLGAPAKTWRVAAVANPFWIYERAETRR